MKIDFIQQNQFLTQGKIAAPIAPTDALAKLEKHI